MSSMNSVGSVSGESKSPFVSTLSTGGFLALADAGFRPLEVVQGVSVLGFGYQRKPSHSMRGAPQAVPHPVRGGGYYPPGAATMQQYVNTGGWFDLEERTETYNNARAQALASLEGAARKAGACAVVDVRIRHGRFSRVRQAIEFTAIGTAVSSDRLEPGDKQPIPIVSLSGSDFWKLVESGIWPLGLVGGTSVVYVWSGRRTQSARFRLSRRSYRNQEHEDYTEGLSHARFGASARLRKEATRLEASGLLGVSVARILKQQRHDDLILTVDLLGTAVAPLESSAPPSVVYALGLGKA